MSASTLIRCALAAYLFLALSATPLLAERKTFWLTDNSSVSAVGFSADGRLLLAADRHGAVFAWDVASYQQVATIRGVPKESVFGAVTQLRAGPDTLFTLANYQDNRDDHACWKRWDTRTWRELEGREVPFWAAALAPSGAYLVHRDPASRDDDPSKFPLKVCDLATGASRTVPHDLKTFHTRPAISPDSSRLATCDRDGVVLLWDVATGKGAGGFREKPGAAEYMAFSPDNRLLAVTDDIDVNLWDLKTLQLHQATPLRAGSGISGVTFSPDGRLLAVACGRSVPIWQVSNRRRVLRLQGHSYPVDCLAFSPDGRLIVSGDRDGAVMLWEVPAPEEE